MINTRHFWFIRCYRASKAPQEDGCASKPTPSTSYPIALVAMHRSSYAGRGTRGTGLIQDAFLPRSFRSNFRGGWILSGLCHFYCELQVRQRYTSKYMLLFWVQLFSFRACVILIDDSRCAETINGTILVEFAIFRAFAIFFLEDARCAEGIPGTIG